MDSPKQWQSNATETDRDFEQRTLSSLSSLRTGLQPSRRLILGKLPPQLSSVQRRRGLFRRSLETAVMQQHGDISLVRASLIAEGSFWFGACALVDWCLRERWSELSAKDLVAMGQRQAYCMRQASKVVQELIQDEGTASSLLAQLEAQYRQSQSSIGNDALDAASGPQEDGEQ